MRSVVVVLPASMCAMIPMFRVFWRVNLRGMAKGGDGRVVSRAGVKRLELRLAVFKQKNGPLGPTRATGLIWTGSRRYLLEISIWFGTPRETCSHDCAIRRASPTIAEQTGHLTRTPGPRGPNANAVRGPHSPLPAAYPRTRRRDARAPGWRRAGPLSPLLRGPPP